MSRSTENPIAMTTSGAVRGAREGDLDVFRGVPYGRVPKRWAAPVPVAPWDGVRDATANGPACPQHRKGPVPALLGDQMAGLETDDDCLSLTIWTPGADDARRPVLVWIHGGGFVGGAGSWEIYSMARVAAAADAVVVSMNYRLGPFGYLLTEVDEGTGGNAWLNDQRLALDWVAENADRFGGDPARITLGGQSGGAYSTVSLLGLPEPPPINRAVLLSAPLGVRARTVAESLEVTRIVREEVGVSTDAELREVEPDRLLATIPAVLAKVGRYAAVVPPFMPTVSEPELPPDVTPRFVARGGDLELLVGWTAKEMGFFLPMQPTLLTSEREQVIERMVSSFGDRAADAYEVYAAAGSGSPADVVIDYTSDELFRIPALELARGVEAAGGRAKTFQLDADSNAVGGKAGAAHCVDIPFFTDQLDTWKDSGGSLFAEMDVERYRPLATTAHAALVAFVQGEQPWDGGAADVHDLSLGIDRAEVVPGAIVDLWR